MTTDEKLKHFTTVILESTQSQCEQSFDEYKKSLDRYLEKHKEDALKQKKYLEDTEADSIRRKSSKEYTMQQLRIRRMINHKQEAIKVKLLVEVQGLLEKFFETEDYKKLLIKQIKDAVKVARNETIAIYLDVKDEKLKSELQKETGEELIIDGRTFFGGIVAEIPKKNILIDNSFESKLDNFMENYFIEP